MIARVINGYRVELAKALRHWSTYAGPLIVAAAATGAYFIHPFARDGESDYDFIAYAAPLAINLVGFVVILVYATGLVSSEIAQGTLRNALVRRLRRRDIIAAKFLFGVSYVIAIDLVVCALVWIAPALLGDLSGVRFGGEILYTNIEMLISFATAAALCLVPQSAAVAFGLFFSVCTKNATAAAAIAVGLWLVIEAAKAPLGIDDYVFFGFLDWPWQVFADHSEGIETAWLPQAAQALAVSGVSGAVFLLLAAFVLSRRNLAT